MEFDLLNLPNELIIRVVELVDSLKALSRLACCSKRMQELTEPILYNDLLIKDASTVRALVDAFKGCPKRALAAHNLDVPSHQSMARQMNGLKLLLTQMPGLRNLMFESPFVNTHNFESPDVWTSMTNQLFTPFCLAALPDAPSPIPLQKLTHLTLHLNGPLSPYWDLDERSVSIFKHPTLVRVHVSCMNLVAERNIDAEPSFFTPLKHLVLEECNISVAALTNLLNLPKALEILELGENSYNFLQFRAADVPLNANLLFRIKSLATMVALRQQSHSLRSLTYIQNELYSLTHHGEHLLGQSKDVEFLDGGFEDFAMLEKVHLRGYCPNFTRAVLNYNSPPSLRELTVELSDHIWADSEWSSSEEPTPEQLIRHMPYLNVKYPNVPASLKSITLVYVEDGWFDSESWVKSTARRNISKLANAIKAKFGLLLFFKQRNRTRYFPPYLYGEPVPKEELMYDGEAGAFTDAFEKWVSGADGTATFRYLEDDPDYAPDEHSDDDDDDGVWPVV